MKGDWWRVAEVMGTGTGLSHDIDTMVFVRSNRQARLWV